MHKGIELVNIEGEWDGWMFKKGYLVNNKGIKLTPNQILTGYALLEIGAENDRKIQKEIVRIARLFGNLPKI
ncbi:DUF3653 domain-containing protein [Photobacterium leiognathi]|uniref:DUF3653 domain-containing protein n=1 Tax=Photobacterium leiognathi TaxID=553611 RepID=UPI003DA06404